MLKMQVAMLCADVHATTGVVFHDALVDSEWELNMTTKATDSCVRVLEADEVLKTAVLELATTWHDRATQPKPTGAAPHGARDVHAGTTLVAPGKEALEALARLPILTRGGGARDMVFEALGASWGVEDRAHLLVLALCFQVQGKRLSMAEAHAIFEEGRVTAEERSEERFAKVRRAREGEGRKCREGRRACSHGSSRPSRPSRADYALPCRTGRGPCGVRLRSFDGRAGQ